MLSYANCKIGQSEALTFFDRGSNIHSIDGSDLIWDLEIRESSMWWYG